MRPPCNIRTGKLNIQTMRAERFTRPSTIQVSYQMEMREVRRVSQAEPSTPTPPSNAALDAAVLEADRKAANAKTKKALEQKDSF